MSTRKPLYWCLRIAALALIILFFVPMFTVSCAASGQKEEIADPVSLSQVATGTGEAMEMVAEQQKTRTKAYPLVFLFLLVPIAAIAVSFFKKLESLHMFVFGFTFMAEGIALIILALSFLTKYESSGIIIGTNAFFHIYYFIALICALVSSGFLLKDVMNYYRYGK
ncbi:MAG: hypothetical protein IJF71_04635 [Clostridia bacterium]|nr:hypothetical protein [Clostridia bacterium]